MHEINDEVYVLLGRISVGMEHVHHQLALMVSSICARRGTSSKLEQSLTAAVSFRQLTDLCEMLYLSLSESEEGKDEFKSLIKRINDLGQKRNRIVHSVWKPLGADEIARWRFSKDKNKGIRFSNERFDFSHYREAAEECEKLYHDIVSFIYRDFSRGGSPFYVHEVTP